MTKILVLYYSSWGHIEQLAQAEAEGARSAGAEVALRRVPELVPEAVARQAHYKLDQRAPIATVDELVDYDGIIFGTPTRFGNVAAQMRNFLDQTGGLFAQARLAGKVGSIFTSSGQQHWGQESTILAFQNFLFHHGFVVLGVPPTTPGLHVVSEMSGGTPYGASTIAGADGSRQPSENELAIARAQGAWVAEIAMRLHGGAAPAQEPAIAAKPALA